MIRESLTNWLARPNRATNLNDVPDVSASLGTTVGLVRKENQDRSVLVRRTSARAPDASFLCLAICDGMGGMQDGAHCAELGLGVFIDELASRRSRLDEKALTEAAKAANSEIYRRYREKGGTTIAAVILTTRHVLGVTVGDSRIYVFGKDTLLKQIGADDTVANEIQRHSGSTHVVDTAPFAGQLTQFLGMGDSLQPHIYTLSAENSYLLTSDGIHSVSPLTLQLIAKYANNARELVSRLLNVANWCGGRDNGSAICIDRVSLALTEVGPYASGEQWLEVWDPAGKLEMPISVWASPPEVSRGDSPRPKPIYQDKEAKTSALDQSHESELREDKSAPSGRQFKSRSPKKKASQSRRSRPEPHENGQKLQIEILDPGNEQGSATLEEGSDSGPEKPAEAPVNGPQGVPAAKQNGLGESAVTLPFEAPAENGEKRDPNNADDDTTE